MAQLQWWPADAVQAKGSVLVVDQDRCVCEQVGAALSSHGFTVHTATVPDGPTAFTLASKLHPDVVLMEVDLDGINGFEVLRRLREHYFDGEVVFLSGRSTTADKIEGLTLGAADYMTKPYDLAEVTVRLRSILRRSRRVSELSQPDRRVVVADLALDLSAYRVEKAGVAVKLSPTEFRLLNYFMDNPDKVLSYGDIIDNVWGGDDSIDENVVRTYVKYLRRKVDPDVQLLCTVRGVGYVLRRPRT